MKHLNCRICGAPVVLSPSANQRAKNSGYSANYYRNLFPDHAQCVVAKNSKEVSDLMAKLRDAAQDY